MPPASDRPTGPPGLQGPDPAETPPDGATAVSPCHLHDLLPALHARLLRFARAQLRNPTLAEDAVGETVLSALQAGLPFTSAGQATAWVFGVLRHKLADQRRQQRRLVPSGDLVEACDAAGAAWSGGWHDDGTAAGDPEAACARAEFHARVLRGCAALPRTWSRAFVMRDLLDMDTAAIGQRLGVSEGHVWVLLHRARTRLRRELQEGGVAGRVATGRSKASTQP